jgi:hypothetical protein
MNVQSVNAISSYYQQGLSASPVSVAQALSFVKANPRASFMLIDSAANIEKNFTSLANIVNNIKTVTLTDTASGAISVTAKQLLSPNGTLLSGKMSLGGNANPIGLNVTEVQAKDIENINGRSKVNQFSVKDTAVNLSGRFDALKSSVAKLGDVITTNSATSITLTVAQYETSSAVLNHFVGTFALEVSGAKTAQALSMAGDSKVAQINIVDHAQAISDNLDALQNMGLKLKSLTSDDTNVFKVSAEQLQKDGAAIGKIYKGYQLAVFNLDASTAAAIKSNNKIISLDIVDTAEGISKNLPMLSRLGAQLHSLQISDTATSALEMSAKDYFAYESTLSKIVRVQSGTPPITNQPVNPVNDKSSADYNNFYTIKINAARAVDAQAIKSDDHITSIAVTDLNSEIAINFDDLQSNSKVSNIDILGANKTINISSSQWLSDADLVNRLKTQNGNVKFSISGVAASEAKLLLSDASNRISSVTVADSAANIVSNLTDLAALGKNLTSIVQTDARQQASPGVPLSLTASNWMANIGVLSKITGGYGVKLTEVTASKALSLANDIRVKSFEIKDSGASIAANLQGLQNLGAKLISIRQSDESAIQVTGSQYSAYQNTITKLGDDYKLSVVAAKANQIATLASDAGHVQNIQVLDSVGNVTNNLSSLEVAAADQTNTKISVTIAGSPQPFSLTAQQVSNNANALKSIVGNYKVMVSDVNASDAKDFASNSDLAKNSHLLSMSVRASASELSSTQQLADLNALGNMVSQVNQSDKGTTISLKLSDWQNNANVFSKTPGYQVALSEVKAASAQNLLKNPHVESVQVIDTYDQISQNFDKLMTLGNSVSQILRSTGDASNLHLSVSQWKLGDATLQKLPDDYLVDISGATTQDAIDLSVNSAIASIAVMDSAYEVSSKFDALASNLKISSVNLTSAGVPITLSQTQLSNNGNFLNKLVGGYALSITDAAAENVTALLANTHVISADVKDTGTNILGALSNLSKLGSRLKGLSLTDTNPELGLRYSDFQKYKNILGLISQPFKVSLNHIKASEAVLEGQNAKFNFSMQVKDTTSQVAANLDGLAELRNKLTSITTSDPQASLVIKTSQFIADQSALDKINFDQLGANYQVALSGGDLSTAKTILLNNTLADHVLSMEVSDDADAISKGFDSLSSNKITAVQLPTGSQTLSISGNQFAQSSSLAKVKGVFNLVVEAAQASQAQALENDQRVLEYSITATSSSIGSSLASLLDLSKLEKINISQDQDRMSLTLAQFNGVKDSFNKIFGNFELNVSQASVADLDVLNTRSEVFGVSITDSSQSIANGWDSILSMGDRVLSIQSNSPQVAIAINYDLWNQSTDSLAKLSQNQTVALLDVPPDQAVTASTFSKVSAISVNGSPNQVALNFTDLVGLGTKLESIQLNSEEPLELTQDQVDSDIGGTTLAKINGTFDLQIVT